MPVDQNLISYHVTRWHWLIAWPSHQTKDNHQKQNRTKQKKKRPDLFNHYSNLKCSLLLDQFKFFFVMKLLQIGTVAKSQSIKVSDIDGWLCTTDKLQRLANIRHLSFIAPVQSIREAGNANFSCIRMVIISDTGIQSKHTGRRLRKRLVAIAAQQPTRHDHRWLAVSRPFTSWLNWNQ